MYVLLDFSKTFRSKRQTTSIRHLFLLDVRIRFPEFRHHGFRIQIDFLSKTMIICREHNIIIIVGTRDSRNMRTTGVKTQSTVSRTVSITTHYQLLSVCSKFRTVQCLLLSVYGLFQRCRSGIGLRSYNGLKISSIFLYLKNSNHRQFYYLYIFIQYLSFLISTLSFELEFCFKHSVELLIWYSIFYKIVFLQYLLIIYWLMFNYCWYSK